MHLSDLGEFGFIERVRRWLPVSGAALGLMDDAAVVKLRGGTSLVVTTDALVEGTHFRFDWSCPADVGFKAVVVNVSDVAAMGATPRWLLVTLAAPPSIEEAVVREIYAGITEACATYEVEVIGGDTVRAEKVMLGVTALGEVDGEPLLRSEAVMGDVLAVSGPLGKAAAGVELLRAGKADDGPACVAAHRRPQARVDLATTLRALGMRAAMDLSDGLGSDAQRMAEASCVGVEIDASCVPVDDEARRVAETNGWDALGLALYGGEDYELLVAAPPEVVRAAGLVEVGRIVDDGAWLVSDGGREALGEGYDAFRSR